MKWVDEGRRGAGAAGSDGKGRSHPFQHHK